MTVPRRRPARRPLALALALALTACQDPPAPPPRVDAAVAAADTGAVPARRRHRGRRRRVATATAGAHAAGQPPAPATSAPGEDPLEPAEPPAARPRITETGPMLTEDLGPPPAAAYDMGAASDGPMGLEPDQIARAMRPLMGRLGTCAEATTDDQGHGPRGRVTVRLRIRGDGDPVAARVSGGGGPPEFKACVRRVIASARFPSFRGPDVMATWGFDVEP